MNDPKKCWYCQDKKPVKDQLMCKDCGNIKKKKISTTMGGDTQFKYNF